VRTGAGLCPDCRNDVLWLPTADGTQTLDQGEFAFDTVQDGDRFVVLGHRSAVQLDSTTPAPATCLRLHRCLGPSPTVADTERDSLRRPSRTDFTALRRFITQVELYRSQMLGRLRRHPGQRVYEPVAVTPRLATLGRLDSKHCVLCRREIDENESVEVGSIDGKVRPLQACSPTCPPSRHSDLG